MTYPFTSDQLVEDPTARYRTRVMRVIHLDHSSGITTLYTVTNTRCCNRVEPIRCKTQEVNDPRFADLGQGKP